MASASVVLPDDATAEDMDNWEGISQPPFYELQSFVFIAAGGDLIAQMSMTSLQEYLLVGLDVAGMSQPGSPLSTSPAEMPRL